MEIESINIIKTGSLDAGLRETSSCACSCRCGGSCGEAGIPVEQQPVDINIYNSTVKSMYSKD